MDASTSGRRSQYKQCSKPKDRVAEAYQHSKSRREAALSGRRLRTLGLKELAEANTLPHHPEAVDLALQEAISQQKSPDKFFTALRKIRLILSSPKSTDHERETLLKSAIAAGLIQTLTYALRPSLESAEAASAALQASWIACNVAVEASCIVQELLPLGPLLIAHLNGGYGSDLAMHCAWALANIAGNSEERKQTLVAQGALPSLLGLLQSSSNASTATVSEYEATATAVWAINNIVRGPSGILGSFVCSNGLADAIIPVLSLNSKTHWSLVTEVCWLLSYVTAGKQAYSQRILSPPVLLPLLNVLVAAAQTLQQHTLQPHGCELAASTQASLTPTVDEAQQVMLPILRCLGNLVPVLHQNLLKLLFTWNHGDALMSLIVTAASGHAVLHKEATWVISNCAGCNVQDEEAYLRFAQQAAPVLRHLLLHSTCDVRSEAACAFSNFALRSTESCAVVSTLVWSDPQLILSLLEMLNAEKWDCVLSSLQMMKAVCGYDALASQSAFVGFEERLAEIAANCANEASLLAQEVIAAMRRR